MLQWIKNRWHDFTRAFTGWIGVTLAALIGIIVGSASLHHVLRRLHQLLRQRPGHLQPVSRDERAVQRLAEGAVTPTSQAAMTATPRMTIWS